MPAEDVVFTRREFLARAALVGGAAALAPGILRGSSRPASRPNILFILTDDQLRERFGCYGSNEGLTPNVDALAAGGARFTRACVTSALCSPSRVSCLTGRYAGRFQPYVGNNASMRPGQPTVATFLTAVGYQTGFIGKQHASLNRVGARDPNERARRAGFAWAEHAHVTRFNVGDHLDPNEGQEAAFDAATRFVTANKERPFALFLFTTLTHGPAEAPQKYIDQVKGAASKAQKAMYLWLDTLVGRLIGTIEALGLRDRTAVFYAGDNAPTAGGRVADESRNKGTVYDGWVPQVVSWPKHIKSGLVIDQVVQNIDFLPTILDLCGVDVPASARVDGRSFLPLLRGEAVKWREEAFFEVESARAVRTDRWKYIAVRPVERSVRSIEKQVADYGGSRDLLFDLIADPQEKKNLFGDPAHAAVVRDMQARLRRLCGGYDYAFGEFGAGSGSAPASRPSSRPAQA